MRGGGGAIKAEGSMPVGTSALVLLGVGEEGTSCPFLPTHPKQIEAPSHTRFPFGGGGGVEEGRGKALSKGTTVPCYCTCSQIWSRLFWSGGEG